MKSRLLLLSLTSILALGTLLMAQPKRNVSAARHPNLAAAQRLMQQAWDKIEAAQQANEFDLGGHAKKAKEHLDAANREIKLAAETANQK